MKVVCIKIRQVCRGHEKPKVDNFNHRIYRLFYYALVKIVRGNGRIIGTSVFKIGRGGVLQIRNIRTGGRNGDNGHIGISKISRNL